MLPTVVLVLFLPSFFILIFYPKLIVVLMSVAISFVLRAHDLHSFEYPLLDLFT